MSNTPILERIGFRLITLADRLAARFPGLLVDLDGDFFPLYERCRPFTMTSVKRMYVLYQAVEYVAASRIPGDVVECGVWRGGSSMMAALALLKNPGPERKIYMYDTYEGMSKPTDQDIPLGRSAPAYAVWKRYRDRGGPQWFQASLEEVKANLRATGYPSDRLIFVKGKVEDTLPGTIPDRIALLRLDTDWYESTYHEMVHLYPRLVGGGVLILDDYGHWKGSRAAVDRYFRETPSKKPLLSRIDYTARIGVKLDD